MFANGASQTGAGRYYQHHGALRKVGEELAAYGGRVYLLYDSEHIRQKTAPVITESLADRGLDWAERAFDEPATGRNFRRIADDAAAQGADIILGVGGGRVLDIAKAAGELAGLPTFTAPTSAATCAAFAILYVAYNEDGSIAANSFLHRAVNGVFVDLDYVLDDCPARYFVSGVADALAKLPEFRFTSQLLREGQSAPVEAAVRLAEYTYRRYLDDGLQAVEDFAAHRDTPLLDDFVSLNIQLTGLISDLSTGGKSHMICHNFYDAVCRLHPDIRRKFLHGELVGLALPLQLYVLGDGEDEIREVQRLLRAMGVPVRLADIGFPAGEIPRRELVDYIYRVTKYESDALYDKIKTGLQYMEQ